VIFGAFFGLICGFCDWDDQVELVAGAGFGWFEVGRLVFGLGYMWGWCNAPGLILPEKVGGFILLIAGHSAVWGIYPVSMFDTTHFL
jgi:hypothetical protein